MAGIGASRTKIGNGDTIFTIANYIMVTVFFVTVLYPVVYVASASITNPIDVATGKMWLFPTSFNFEAYKMIFRDRAIWTGYRNTVFYTAAGTAMSVFVTLFAAYALSRKDLAGRKFFAFFFAFTMFFNGGMIPTYLIVKDLGIIDTPLAMIVPGMLSIWNMIVTRTFIQASIPGELLESAKIDGCSDFGYFWKIVMPLSGSIIAVITLFYAVGLWNQYFNALLYINSKKLAPLSIILRDILIKNEINEAIMDAETQARIQNMRDLLKYALIIVASVPVLVLYPFIQKHFVKGVMIGSLKG